MRRLLPLAAFSLLTACGDSNRTTTTSPPTHPAATTPTPAATVATAAIQLECPNPFTAVTKLPAGTRVLGSYHGTLALLQADISSGVPDGVQSNWRLSALKHGEENESASQPGGGLRTGYALRPIRSDAPGQIEQYMLACSYGPNWEALSSRSNAALVLIPIPVASTARCEIVDAPVAGDVAQVLRSATCTIQSGPRESPPQVRALLEQWYARYQSKRWPDTLGDDAPSIFSSKLLALIRESQQPIANGVGVDEVGPLDGDPLCDCQDWQALTVKQISVVAIDDDEAVAKVMFTNAGKPITMGINLLREAGQWRIDDLSAPPPRGLVWYLSEALQERHAQTP